METFGLPSEKKTGVIHLAKGIGSIDMRKVSLETALVFACLGATFASAETLIKHQHSTAGSGVGGWTMGSAVGGWKQNSTTKMFNSESATGVSSGTNTEAFGSAKAFTSASAGGVSTGTIAEASSASAGAVSSSATSLSGSRPLPPRFLSDDSGCVFVAQETPTGNRWRPGCK
jgi:hypothetical protein